MCIKCQDEWPDRFKDLTQGFVPDEVENEVGIALDVSSASRLGIYQKADISVCIDHHKSNLCEIENTYLEENKISCSTIVFKLLELMNVTISTRIRELLFVGLITDSDGFRVQQ